CCSAIEKALLLRERPEPRLEPLEPLAERRLRHLLALRGKHLPDLGPRHLPIDAQDEQRLLFGLELGAQPCETVLRCGLADGFGCGLAQLAPREVVLDARFDRGVRLWRHVPIGLAARPFALAGNVARRPGRSIRSQGSKPLASCPPPSGG